MLVGNFSPAERAREKQASRDRDISMLANGDISVRELRQQNGMLAGFDLAHSSVVLPANRY